MSDITNVFKHIERKSIESRKRAIINRILPVIEVKFYSEQEDLLELCFEAPLYTLQVGLVGDNEFVLLVTLKDERKGIGSFTAVQLMDKFIQSEIVELERDIIKFAEGILAIM